MKVAFHQPKRSWLHGKEGQFVQCSVWINNDYSGQLYFDLHRQKWIWRLGYTEMCSTHKRNLVEAKAALSAFIAGFDDGRGHRRKRREDPRNEL
mgnify:CR=1 FL=1